MPSSWIASAQSNQNSFSPGSQSHAGLPSAWARAFARSVARVDKIREDLADCRGWSLTLPQTALKFAMQHPAVSTVIPGIRSVEQAEQNIAVSDLPDLPAEIMTRLRTHLWRRGFWYGGK